MSHRRRQAAFFLIFLVIWGLTTHGKYSVSGDEPHYLIIAESLLSDGDLDLANNYANDDGRLFGHAGLGNDGHARPTPAGPLESAHDIGLPVLLLPAYAAARAIGSVVPPPWLARARMNRGLFVYSLVSLSLIALVAWGCVRLLGALEAAWPDHRAAYLLYLVALSPPVLSHAFLVFPETVMFVVVCLLIAAAAETAGDPGDRAWVARTMILALAVGCAPWLHRKFTPLVLSLAAAFCWRSRERLRQLPRPQLLLLAALVVTPVALLYLWTWSHWGTIAGPQFLHGSRLDLARVPNGLLGLFADRRSGLLAYAPFYIVVPACILGAVKGEWPWLIAAATLVLPMAAFDEWWAGFAPAARYLVPVVPIVAVCIARMLVQRRLRLTLAGLAALQVAINVVAWQRPRLLWPDETMSNGLLVRLGPAGALWQRVLPDVRSGVTAGAALAVVILLVVVTIALRWPARTAPRVTGSAAG